MNTLYIDLEAYSERDIKKGTYQYAENSSVLLIAFAYNDEVPAVIDVSVSEDAFRTGMEAIRSYIGSADRIVAHNSAFDRNVLKYNGYDIPVGRWEDTMIRAYMHSLPGGLLVLSGVYKLPADIGKGADGRRLIRKFCIPQKDGSRIHSYDDPENWAAFIDYAGKDISALRQIDKKLPTWNCTETEMRAWRLDQKINGRGFKVDIELAEAALHAVGQEKKKLNKRTEDITGGALDTTTRRDAMLKHVFSAYGVELPDLQASTVQRRMQDPDLPLEVKELLDIRSKVCLTSNRKYKALLNAVSKDGRLRGTLQFCGAQRTGRFCLAEGSMVRVNTGSRIYEKPIEDVTTEEMVWDGDEWVEHDGVVANGEKEVIEHDKILATPEHIVYISSKEKMPLGEAMEKEIPLWRGN